MAFSMRPTEPSSGLEASVLVELSLCTALLLVIQVAMAALPNIELVTLLVMLYTRWFGRRTLLILLVFAFVEGLIYGFHLWWLMYLYVWPLLWLAVTLLGKTVRPAVVWAALGGLFGLVFGLLCSLPYLALGGIHTALGWWIAGIPFDLIHGCSNFVLILVLFSPLDSLYRKMRGGRT